MTARALFPPIAKPDPAALRQEAARNEAAAAEAAAPHLDLDDRLIKLTGWEGFQIVFFTHVPYFALIEKLHLRAEWLALPFMAYVTHRFASGDRTRFTRRALAAGIGSALFCVGLELALGPHAK